MLWYYVNEFIYHDDEHACAAHIYSRSDSVCAFGPPLHPSMIPQLILPPLPTSGANGDHIMQTQQLKMCVPARLLQFLSSLD